MLASNVVVLIISKSIINLSLKIYIICCLDRNYRELKTSSLYLRAV